MTQIRRADAAAAQTAAVEEPPSPSSLENQEQEAKDLTTYAISYAAVLAAAIAVMGLLASTIDATPADSPASQVVVAQAGGAHDAATMNIPF